MSHSNYGQPLMKYYRSQIVQEYPPIENPFMDSLMVDEKDELKDQYDFFEEIMKDDNEIVQHYHYGTTMIKHQFEKISQSQPFQHSFSNFSTPLSHQYSKNNNDQSRNSSLSSRENRVDLLQRSFQKFQTFPFLKKCSDGMMEQQNNTENQLLQHVQQNFAVQTENLKEKQRREKIQKLQQVGCNCRKSKCLKMYCQCFHLQILCNENCNCVGCGNKQTGSHHHQAVLDALTRNPKAFQEQKPKIQKGFGLGVGLQQVKKGCKCKKTKCIKKYCQCFGADNKCGKFCRCENCQNAQ